MTDGEEGEHNWVTSGNPVVMLEMLQGRASQRKRRLFACAATRALGPLTQEHGELRSGLEMAERHADGLADDDELSVARERIEALRGRMNSAEGGLFVARAAAILACGSLELGNGVYHSIGSFVRWLGSVPRGLAPGRLPDLLRDVFANPFRTPPLPDDLFSWQGGTVVRLAQAAYDDRELPAATLDPVRLNVLADALEDAGCSDEAILSHLRASATHVRGCWVIDRILGKQ
jgi:hypothetical protein